MVSIIILSYNTKDLLHSCLSHIFSKLSKGDFEVIVVDNASRDESVAMLKKQFPQVRVIENTENYGFAKGNNIGARKANGDILCFLNSDTNILSFDVSSLEMTFAKDSHIGAVGGRLENADGSPQRSYSGFYTLPRLFLMLYFGDKGEQAFQQQSKRSVDWVSGGFLFVPKRLFEAVGGFDEQFFMYIEDMELCYRIKKKNYTILYDPTLRAEHAGQGSSNRSFAIRHIYKGILYFYKKHIPSQYGFAKLLLTTKAFLVIFFSLLTANRVLRKAYRNAVQF